MSSFGEKGDDARSAHTNHNTTESRQKRTNEHDAEQFVEHESHSPSKEVRTSLSRTASPASLDQRNDHDEEKGLPVAGESPKDTTEVINAEHDPNIVDWEDNEPGNPYNWTPKKKWLNIAVLSALTLLTPLGSSFFAPAVPRVMADFNSTSELEATFVVSVYLLGFAFGPILIAPCSELYGRLIVYHICNVGYLVFTIACALATNMNMLIGFRFLAGCFGVAPVTIGGGTVADMMKPEDRGLAMSLWAMGALFGPVIGPVCGGFLSQAAGWRWIFWVLAIAIGVVSIVAAPIIRETYAPVLLERKTERLRKETGNSNLRSKLQQNLTPKEVFIRAISRPTKLLFLSPICGLMSLYMGMDFTACLLIWDLILTDPKLLFTESCTFCSQHSPSSSSNRMALVNLLGTFASIPSSP